MKLHLVSCLGSVLSPQVMGNPLSIRRCLQALAASRATREPPVRRVSQVGGHFHHHMKLHLVSCLGSVLSPQLMGNPLSIRRCLQALAASWATREPPVRRVSQVGGHFHHHMKLHLVSCLGSVLSPQLMGNPLSMRQRLQVLAALRARRVPPVRRVSQVGGHCHHHMKQILSHALKVCHECE